MSGLDTNTFVIVLAVALAAMGIVIWLRFRAESKKQP
jgi:hypothetical protein